MLQAVGKMTKMKWVCRENGDMHLIEDDSQQEPLHEEFGCFFPLRFNTSEGRKTMQPGKLYDRNLNEIRNENS